MFMYFAAVAYVDIKRELLYMEFGSRSVCVGFESVRTLHDSGPNMNESRKAPRMALAGG